MEEKERYEIHIYDDICVDLYDNGVLDKSINDTYKLEELLNQQSKRLKELEQENQQLKQQLHDLPKKKEIHKKYCDDCLKFQLGVCGGAQYYIPNICEQPLCDKVRNKLKELKNE